MSVNARKLEQIDTLGDRLEFLEKTFGFRDRHHRVCMKLFKQINFDPLPVEKWGVMFGLWIGNGTVEGIPEPTQAVILEDCVEQYREFAEEHAKLLEGGMTFDQSMEWSERSLAWARFWSVRAPLGREAWIEMARAIEDDLAKCANRAREIWRKRGLDPKMVSGKLVLTPIKDGGE